MIFEKPSMSSFCKFDPDAKSRTISNYLNLILKIGLKTTDMNFFFVILGMSKIYQRRIRVIG